MTIMMIDGNNDYEKDDNQLLSLLAMMTIEMITWWLAVMMLKMTMRIKMVMNK